MKTIIYRFYFLAISALFIANTANSQYFYDYHEGFGDKMEGWYVKNNTYPQPYKNVTWSTGGSADGYLGPVYGSDWAESAGNFLYKATSLFNPLFGLANTFTTYDYNYASVGYTTFDYDDATISQWLISPELHNVKNGDKIQFLTRRKSMDVDDKIADYFALDVNAYADQNRPNRLEVRMWNMGKNQSGKLPNVGNSADSYGDFTIQLDVINDGLTLEGYPADWELREYTISGLPPNKLTDVRIGFWYHFPHGGYNNQRSRFELPVTGEERVVLDALSELTDGAGYVGDAITYIEAFGQTLDLLAPPYEDEGYNGTFIAIDEFRLIRKNGPILFGPYDSYFLIGNTNASWETGTMLGYSGTPNCPNGYLTNSTTFVLLNNGNEELLVYPKIWFDNFEPFEVTTSTNSIAPGERAFITLKLKDDGLWPGSFSGKLAIHDFAGATNHTQYTYMYLDIGAEIAEDNPPKVRATSNLITLTLDENGEATITDPLNYTDGYEPSCGDSVFISFSCPWGAQCDDGQSITFDCDNLGMKDVYLIIRDENGNSSSDKFNVFINEYPSYSYGNLDLDFYVTDSTNSIPVDSLYPPEILIGCANGSWEGPYITGFYGSLSSPESLGVGEYKARWVLRDIDGDAHSVTQNIEVIDTIKPVAVCQPITTIGFNNKYNEQGYNVSGLLYGYDIGPFSHDNNAIRSLENKIYPYSYDAASYQVSVPWYNGGAFSAYIPYDCTNAGNEYTATLKVIDESGNENTCQSTIKIASPDQPECKDLTINLPEDGYKFINAGDLLLSGGDASCGILSSSVDRTRFDCDDVNMETPVTVTYTDASNNEHSCVSKITVNQITDLGNCEDTVFVYVQNGYLEASYNVGPILETVCSEQLTWSATSTGTTSFNLVNQPGDSYSLQLFKPGISYITRTTEYLDTTYQCSQVIVVIDTVAPLIKDYDVVSGDSLHYEDIDFPGPSLPDCTRAFELPVPFVQGSYQYWTYNLSGNTTDSAAYYNNVSYYEDWGEYMNWQDIWIDIVAGDYYIPGSGVTTLTFRAFDYAGNMQVVEYDIDLRIQNLNTYAYSSELANMEDISGNFDTETYDVEISSPMGNVCNQTGYYWFYEVWDTYGDDQLLYSQDSIPQNSGATIPLKIMPKYNVGVWNEIRMGYYDKQYGDKEYTLPHISISVTDTIIDEIICPDDVLVESNNDSTFTYTYSINPPDGLNAGSFWGYSISGSTNLSTKEEDVTVALNSNQSAQLDFYTSLEAYPVFPYDSVPVVQLNIGTNYIFLNSIEPNGNYDTYGGCTYIVEVVDSSSPSLSCASDVVLHRTSSESCDLSIGDSIQQISGFTGPFGVSRFYKLGGNSKISLDKSNMPASIRFYSIDDNYTVYNDAYIKIEFNSEGTVSFDWEYQSDFPQFFSPFILINDFYAGSWDQPAPVGYTEGNTGIQTGSFTHAVSDGDVLYLGLTEGGASEGYFKISNFSAPYTDPADDIVQPTFNENEFLYFESDIKTNYEIGDYTITYKLKNINNSNTDTCIQNLTVIDDFATSLACFDDTIYLNSSGKAILYPEQVLNSCFPVSSTTVSKDTFSVADIGTQSVTITSIDQSNDTLSCTINLTVLDTIKPVILGNKIIVSLDVSDNGSITDSTLRSYFYDNDTIITVSASKLSFGCNDVGSQLITISATDSSGNSISDNMLVEVNAYGLEVNEPELSDTVCVGEDVRLTTESLPSQNVLLYLWQIQDKSINAKPWNYYSCAAASDIVNGAADYKFQRLKINDYNDFTYMTYRAGATPDIHFKKLNPTKQSWVTVFPSISREVSNAPGTNASFYLGFSEYTAKTPYVLYLDKNGTLHMKRYVVGWSDVSISFYSGYNIDNLNLFYSDDYFFAVHYDGVVHGGKVNKYASNASTVTYMYDPGTSVSNTYVTNAKNVVGIRNDLNQNVFFSLNVNVNDILVGKDSLTTDPTDNSALFTMHSFNDTAYIAYKSSNGKLCVKKYNGDNSWSNVGSLDFSENEIFSVNLGSVEDTLYVVYEELSDTIRISKFDGSSWIEMASPNSNIYLLGINGFELTDIDGVPSIYLAHNRKLLRNDGWENISGATSYYYDISLTEPTDANYRCVSTKSGCSFTVSGSKNIVANEVPVINVTDATIMDEGTATLTALASVGTPKWISAIDSTGYLLASGTSYTTPYLFSDSVFYVTSENGPCYSDTVASHVYLNDHEFADYNITYPDSVCNMETAEIKLDTVEYGMNYSIYTKGQNGNFTKGNIYYDNNGTFIDYPQQTTEYKIKIEEEVLDAAWMSTQYFYYDDYLDFGYPEFSISDSLTIEAWVYGYTTNPSNLLGLYYSVGKWWEAADTRNWEWTAGYFKVHNGNTTRQLVFPNLTSGQWTHIATTAGPDGLAIYYNGVMVASNSDTSAININNTLSNLRIGNGGGRDKPLGLSGFDELRIWNTVRDSAQIMDNYNSCLTGSENGLLIYNNFSVFDLDTQTYESLKGNNAIYQNKSDNAAYQIERNGTCISGIVSEKFLPPFTINVKEGVAQITDFQDYWGSMSDTCGSELVELNASVNYGQVYWWDAQTDGNLVGTGTPFSMEFENDSLLWVGPESQCERYPVFVDVNASPEILSITNDTVCANDQIMSYDFNFDIQYNDEAYDFLLYDSAVGGNLLIGDYPAGCAGGGGGGPEELAFYQQGQGLVFTETDTLYAVGINDCCVGSNRIPVIIHVLDPQLTSAPSDTSVCEGTVTLHATATNYDYIKWYSPDGVSVTHGDTIETHYMTDTNTWYVKAVSETENLTCDLADYTLFDINITRFSENYDSVLVCNSYTWYDSTYTQSDSNLVFYNDYGALCDSVYHLNLMVIIVEDKELSAESLSFCPGDSTTITVVSTQDGFSYTLRDTSDHSIIDGPLSGTGTNLVFNTGALSDTTGFEVFVEKTTIFAGDTLYCSQTLSEIITINVGETGSSRNAFACESYFWKGNTYTESGTYFDTVASVQGCDSILTLNLTILPVSNVTESITACESYTWHDSTYTMSTDSSIWTGTNPYGCDSIVTLNLTINYSNTGDTSAIACESFDWFGSTYTTSGNYNHTLTNIAGCDSVVTLALTINQATTGDTNATSYGEFTWYGTVYDSTGNYTHTLVNAVGCDSVLTLHLTYLPNFDASLSNLTYNDSVVSGFNKDTLVYNAILPYGTTVVPTVIATPTDDDAIAVVSDAASLPGSTTITVTAEDGVTDTVYTINFTVREGTEATGINDWNTASGWDNGVPDSSTTVVIAGGTTSITSDAVCYNLIVEEGATVIVDSGKTLTVLDNVIVNGELTNTGTISGTATKSVTKSFVLASDSTGTASYIGNSPENLTVIVQRYLASSSRWWYVSPPINNAMAADFNATNAGDRLFEYDTENSMWKEITTDTILSVGRGYATKQDVDNEILSFEGALNYGNISLNLVNAGNGWNLAGNPYPSAIDMENLAEGDWKGVSAKYWVKSGDNFKTYNVVSNEATNGGLRYIASAQAFWIKATGDSATIQLSDADRLHNSVAFAKKVVSANEKLSLQISYDNYFDETVIGFSPQASDEFDNWDTEKKFASGNSYPQIYTKADNGEEMAVNFFRYRGQEFSVPVYLSTPNFGVHTIKASDLESLGSAGVFLEDVQEDKLVYLNITPEYTFESMVTEEDPRFVLHIYPLAATSVEGIVSEVNVYAFNKSIYLQAQGLPDDGFATVYDALGRAVASKNVVKNSLNRIEIKDASGWYLVKLVSGNVMINKKVFIR